MLMIMFMPKNTAKPTHNGNHVRRQIAIGLIPAAKAAAMTQPATGLIERKQELAMCIGVTIAAKLPPN